MADNQPRDFDMVLGGEAAPPVTGIVLGGLEGVKSRLNSSIANVQTAALCDALNYGDAGLDLVIETLPNFSRQVQRFAKRLLKQEGGAQGKQALLDYNPMLFFTKLEDWDVKQFDPNADIVSPSEKAYSVNLEKLKLFFNSKNIYKIEALICHLPENYSYKVSGFYDFINLLADNCQNLINLKALFIGDERENQYRKSRVRIGDINLILESCPNLEVLQIRGYCDELECSVLRHDNLKTLIIETASISDIAVEMMCSLNLPALEYFELWMGSKYKLNLSKVIKNIKPVLFSESFPNLRYLGIRSCEYADEIAAAIAQSYFIAESPIVDNLSVLDLSMGNLTDEGLKVLLDCPAIQNLHTLNISNNCVSEEFFEQMEQLSPPDCLLIKDFQEPIIQRNVGISRYYALYE
ncbi:leucine rich repeat variant [Calothrix sp. NIES-4071]|nr:leucine rich repeat variant [Calothrix sp. NIES-4071]BAZ63754.1 leucine rich repeat variant [Calothrix sp. NIES-4105]